MYIHLTTRCNMSCEHCCVSATKTGIDFTLGDFKKVLHNVVLPYTEYVALGGGEPTLNRHFLEMLILSIAHCEDVFVATNGTNTTASVLMAKMAEKGIMTAALSQDWAHDDQIVNPEVIQAFTRPSQSWMQRTDDRREIRNVLEHSIIRVGRAAENENDFSFREGCVCETPQIYPDGRIKHCGCDDAPLIGNWKESFDIEHSGGTCHKEPQDY